MKAKIPDRQERLAAALRENLKRRKARDRAMATPSNRQGGEALEQRQNKAPKPD
ncbi:MAG: hypothetical protein WDM89_17820 [Rhizomicrobium sp.]